MNFLQQTASLIASDSHASNLSIPPEMGRHNLAVSVLQQDLLKNAVAMVGVGTKLCIVWGVWLRQCESVMDLPLGSNWTKARNTTEGNWRCGAAYRGSIGSTCWNTISHTHLAPAKSNFGLWLHVTHVHLLLKKSTNMGQTGSGGTDEWRG